MDEVVDPDSWLLELDLSDNGSYYLIAMDNFEQSLRLSFGNSTFTSDGDTVGKIVKLDPELHNSINIEDASCGLPGVDSYFQFQPSAYIYDGILVVVKDNSVEIIASKNNSMPT